MPRNKEPSRLKIRLKRWIIRGALPHYVHVVVVFRSTTGRLQEHESHSLFLSPLSRYFLPLFSSSLSSLGEFHIRIYNNSLFISLLSLCYFHVYLSLLSSFKEFHLAVHIIKFSFFLFPSQHLEVAVTVLKRISSSCRFSCSLNSRASPPVLRLGKRTLHFFRHAYC